MIPLNQVASVDSGAAPSNIRRLDLMREIRISANTQGRSLGEVVNDIKLRAGELHLPPGYGILYTGEAEEMAESFGYVMQSLILASPPDLRDPGLAVPELRATAGHHVLPAPVAGRRGRACSTW